jgi:uncharacterized protein
MHKKAIVTGASGGIGRAIAVRLVKEGYQITAVSRDATKLKNLIKELGDGHTFFEADLSTEAGQEKVVKALQTDHYNLLVNNAGVGAMGAFTEVPLERLMAMTRLNCDALVKLSHAFLKKAQPGDALVNVSSTLAFLPFPVAGLYSATKAFVTSFSESLWFEQKKRDVYVMALHPGITSTDFQINAGGKMEDIPKGLAQTPEQVAEVAVCELRARKKPTVISGAKNAMLAGISRLIPRKMTVSMMGASASKSASHTS